MTVNSQLFKYDGKNVSFEKFEYINNGLLVGQSKLKMSGTEEVKPLCEWYNTVMIGSTEDNRVFFHSKFLQYHKDRINRATQAGTYNLFVSPHLGGLGFKKYPEIDNYITDFQRMLGTYLYKSINSFEGTLKEYKKKLLFRPLKSDPILNVEVLTDQRFFNLFLFEDLTNLLDKQIAEDFMLNKRVKPLNLDFMDHLYGESLITESKLDYKGPGQVLKDLRKFIIDYDNDISNNELYISLLSDNELTTKYLLCYNNMSTLVTESDNLHNYKNYDVLEVTEQYERFKLIDTFQNENKEEMIDFVELYISNKLDSTQEVREYLKNIPQPLTTNFKVSKTKPIKIDSVLIKKKLDLKRHQSKTM